MLSCPYCEEIERGYFEIEGENLGCRILFESKNFIVFPSLSQIVEGYLLIATKKHYIGLGEIPKELVPELEEVKNKVKEVLSKFYTIPIFFEHGPVSQNKKGGCCIEHAHLHSVPINVDILDNIKKNFKSIKIDNFLSLNKQFKKRIPYFYYENQMGERYLFELFDVIPSQYLRQLVAIKTNSKDKWDWRIYFGLKEMRNTVLKLKGNF